MRDDRTRPELAQLLGDVVHMRVVVVGIMVEDHKCFGIRSLAEAHSLLPGRMPPTLAAMKLLVGVHRIIDHDVGALDQIENILIGVPRLVLGIGQIADRFAVVFNPIARRIVGVIKCCCTDGDTWFRHQRFARVEIVKANFSLEDFERYGEQRRHHHRAENLSNRMIGEQMPGPNSKLILRIKPRNEERQTDDVIEMGVGKKEIRLNWCFFKQGIAEITKARASIKHQQLSAATNLEAGRVAAIAHGFRARTRDTSAHSPETNVEIFVIRQTATPDPPVHAFRLMLYGVTTNDVKALLRAGV